MRQLRLLLKDASGATAVEYGLIAAIISSALIVGLTSFSGVLGNIFTRVSDLMAGAI